MSNLVSTEWLAARLGEVRVVDASWYMPDEKRQPGKEFDTGHIPGAVFFDIDGIADHSTDLPHMMPTPGQFSLLKWVTSRLKPKSLCCECCKSVNLSAWVVPSQCRLTYG